MSTTWIDKPIPQECRRNRVESGSLWSPPESNSDFRNSKQLYITIREDKRNAIAVVNINRDFLRAAAHITEWIDQTDKPSSTIDIKSVLHQAIAKEQEGLLDSALDLIYDAIDDLMWSKNLDEIATVFTKENAESLSIDLALGLLTVTLPVKKQLQSRDDFYRHFLNRLDERKENEPGLLDGLK